VRAFLFSEGQKSVLPILFRTADELDLPAMCELGQEVNLIHYQAWPNIFAPPSPPERDRALWAKSVGDANATAILPLQGDTAIGFINASIHNETRSLAQPLRYCQIGSICVSADHRGLGIGSALMHEIESWAQQKQAQDLRLQVWKFNERAVRLYEELGFGIRSFSMGKLLVAPNQSRTASKLPKADGVSD
jgi:ribosomal protein S18 acetylase RimI-like enzyme